MKYFRLRTLSIGYDIATRGVDSEATLGCTRAISIRIYRSQGMESTPTRSIICSKICRNITDSLDSEYAPKRLRTGLTVIPAHDSTPDTTNLYLESEQTPASLLEDSSLCRIEQEVHRASQIASNSSHS